ncbi:MAG: hypothetical protein SLAVMIC_00070 [uncultured marine phage]|uniref:Uncharacterized protein n=1 Tax=uncultured marine phage TaxID=707152 RepID=A0A8D9CDG3_9VIRU|nr:MAG: hypothetical protein SLAVMIC_00070 [uncultured marine phage]
MIKKFNEYINESIWDREIDPETLEYLDSKDPFVKCLYRIKQQIGLFETEDHPLSEGQFRRQLDFIFDSFMKGVNVEEFEERIINQLDTDTKSIILDEFQSWLEK